MAKTPRAGAKDKDSFVENDEILLGVLTAVDRDANASQRHISSEVGVALGLANAYLRRCVRKGLIKIQQVPRRRYVYYLTPHGFTEKARLTGQYLSASFNFFRRAREQMSELMANCVARKQRRIVLAGVSDLSEVAILCAADHDVELVGIIDAVYADPKFRGLKIYRTLADCGPVDVAIVTDLTSPETMFRKFAAEMGQDRVLAVHLLRLSKGGGPSRSLPSEAAE